MADSPADSRTRVERTFDSVAASYDTEIDFFGPFGRALAAAADLDPGSKVLDLAPGRGAVLRPVREAVGATGSVLGVDLSAQMVEHLATELAAAGIVNAQVRVGDAQDLDLPDGWFDAVTGGFMIFFPMDPVAVLREIRRVLRPGGKVAVSIFDCEPGFPFQAELEEAVGAHRGARGPQSSFNRADVLEPALGQVGFRDVTATQVIERYRFESADHVVRWQMTIGARPMLLALDPEQMAAYRAGMQERLAPFRAAGSSDGGAGDDGPYELVQRARMVVATKPR